MPKFASDTGSLTIGPQVPTVYENMAKHPCEGMSSSKHTMNKERLALQKMSVTYGSHMAQRTVLERNIYA